MELYTITDRPTICDGFEIEYRDWFNARDSAGDAAVEGARDQTPTAFASERFASVISQPDVVAAMWNHCVVTRLAGVLRPGQMDQDLVIKWDGWVALEPYQLKYYTAAGAFQVALNHGLMLWSGAVFVAMFVLSRRKRRMMSVDRATDVEDTESSAVKATPKGLSLRRLFLRTCGVITLSCLVLGVVNYWVLPRTQAGEWQSLWQDEE